MIKKFEIKEPFGKVMSNFDHEINRDIEAKLKTGKFFAEYTAWNFHGRVWFDNGMFHCQIKQYRRHIDTISAKTLDEIMQEACTKYGSD